MQVKVLNATQHPLETVSVVAGTSYGKSDVSSKRVERCYENGHMGVFEHVSVTFMVEGISRASSHQLVRHRLASFVEMSQRYTKVDVLTNDWYVMPEAFDETDHYVGMFDSWTSCDEFEVLMADAADSYNKALEWGIRPEDARFLLPQATKTNIAVTMNLRELYHFFDLRCDKRAQWEIRELAEAMKNAIKDVDDEWRWLIGLWETDKNLTT